MGTGDYEYPKSKFEQQQQQQPHKVAIPPPQPFIKSLKLTVKETLFPDDPLRQFKGQSQSRKFILALQYIFPFFDWASSYNLSFFKSDIIAGITIASLAIPQGISYAKLANLPPILGLYSSFIPPLVYAMMGSSKDLAVGTVAVASLLTGSMLGAVVNANEEPKLYLQLAFTATFFAGVLQASLGILRLGFIVDFLSHATIVGFMGGAATVVCLQQLKGILGLEHFTHGTDLVSVLRSVFSQTHKWRWESAVLGICFLFYLLVARFVSTKRPKLFWISAMAPLTSVILGSVLVYLTHAEKHGVQVIGELKKGLNPITIMDLSFGSPYLSTAIKTGIVTGVIALAEGIAVGRSFAMFKNYNIDGNKEMIAFGMMNIAGSFTSCYLTTGPFSRSAVNFNAGCKTAVSNIVMAIAVMITLLFLTPLFHYTPLVVLSSIIISAMLGLINYEEAIHLWTLDKFDFVVCMSAYFGVVFGSVEIGLVIAVALSLLRVLLFVSRPRTSTLGLIPDSTIYRSMDQYQNAKSVPGILILQIEAPIYFANSSYLRERIVRWVDEEEDRLKSLKENGLQYVILALSAVGNIDTSGITMLGEVKKVMERRGLKLVLANPGGEVTKKMNKAKLIEVIGQEWIYLTVGEAVGACNFMLHTYKNAEKPTSGSESGKESRNDNNV
ncbi:putative SLC26A/SulP transporter, STAS domain, sulfate anion transporter, STAS domain superfamily [Helianthus annuus]|nr:putative SLC26A/SulP transporter, STAS domain, sulfate anion transporter, STAS domain superfamily [Helianthus annuus]KAJ0878148.1 putative SLC26A/SulP transporter, STAS domain, sulfate anion transporter, STAS domain superfamily [Helianthus annuus]KAJ0882422.1 putative SLC26A/SulP transporter, STAS domain superfamily [Helianthus annuus]